MAIFLPFLTSRQQKAMSIITQKKRNVGDSDQVQNYLIFKIYVL